MNDVCESPNYYQLFALRSLNNQLTVTLYNWIGDKCIEIRIDYAGKHRVL